MLENNYELLFNFKYNFLYYIVAFITLIFVIEFYIKKRDLIKGQSILLFIVIITLILLFGTRGEYVGTDTQNNIKYFTGEVQIVSLSGLNDIGLYSVSMIVSKFSNDINVFLIFTAILFLTPFLIVVKNLQLRAPLFFFFCFFSMFFFKGMGINIQKQGISFSFFLLGISYLFSQRKIMSYILFTVAFLFHASIVIPIVVFFISFKVKKTNRIFIVYIVASVLSFLNVNFYSVLSSIPVVNILVESRLDSYYNDVGNYKIGFRPEFWIFNSFFAVIGYITLRNIERFKTILFSKYYKVFYISYMLLSSFFFLMFSARFSDRFGLMSWTLIPFLLLPYLQSTITVKGLNIVSVYFICLLLFFIFNTIQL